LSDGLAAGKFLEHAAQHRFDRCEDVVLRDEAHFHVKLIEFAWRAIGAGILVAKARRDLEIAVEARHHDELLELLRRLRQRVEFPGMQARGHEIIARAFRRRRSQDRRLEFEETGLFHAPADRIDDLPALDDVVVQPLAPQVEETVFQPRLFRIFLVAKHRHRQFAGRPQHLNLGDIDFHHPGRQVGIFRAGRPMTHLAIDPHHPLRAQLFGLSESRTVGIGHHLRQAVVIAQIDEQHAAVVADTVAPAGEADGLAGMLFAKRAAGMGAVAVHQNLRLDEGGQRRAKSAWGSCFVKASGLDRPVPICTTAAAPEPQP
jgi:hypothetical protein